jgi:hypothetical protein
VDRVAISYDDASAAAAVRDKIERKMDTAKTFGGLLTLALTIVLGVLVDSQKLGAFGPGCGSFKSAPCCTCSPPASTSSPCTTTTPC